MIAEEVMSDNPKSIREDASIGEAVEVFVSADFRHLPVLRGRELVGMLSNRDVQTLITPRLVDIVALEQLKARYDDPVSELMSTDVVKVYPDTDLGEVIDRMLEEKVGALPVVDADTGDLLGIVSYVDVLRSLRDEAVEA
ncbi:MAG: CBS domain-containing protein [Polyangiaceae bacterium]|nr:CBS domain-containing protein [Polyangiaceae bacterium]